MNILLLTSNSITIEILNDDCYFTTDYDVFLNDKFYARNNKNVFTIYDLTPDTNYVIKVNDKSLKFKTLNYKIINYYSKNLQYALDHLSENEVLHIDGNYLVTSLFLRNNNKIYLTGKLRGQNDRKLFPILSKDEVVNGIVLGTWEGKADDCFSSIITGIDVKNILIYGDGVIDCEAHLGDWWKQHRILNIARRPKGIFLHTCENVTFEGITVCNTPSWNQHPFYSKHLNYINMKLLNPADSPTTDGIDPESCEDVKIIGTYISVGDDCIAIKSGKIDFARKYKTPSKNIIIRNCFMEDGHGGVTLGSENSGGICDVSVSQCLFKNTDRGLRIKSQRTRGNLAIIDNIIFNNITMDGVKSPFVINAFYKAGNDICDFRFDRNYMTPSDITPIFKTFTFTNIRCYNVCYGLAFFLGLPESMISGVTLKNIDVNYDYTSDEGQMAMTMWDEKFKNVGIVCENVNNLILQNVTYNNEPSVKFILRNVGNVEEI